MSNNSVETDRQNLIAQLDGYSRSWPKERSTADKLIEFVSREPACFERSTLEGHITGAAWLVDGSGFDVLLTHHRKLNKWLQLGGHADGNGNVFEVALLEAQEESGITDIRPLSEEIFDIDIHPIPSHGGVPGHLHFDIRYSFRAPTRAYVVSDESHDLAWVPINRLSEYTTEASMKRMAEKWLLVRP